MRSANTYEQIRPFLQFVYACAVCVWCLFLCLQYSSGGQQCLYRLCVYENNVCMWSASPLAGARVKVWQQPGCGGLGRRMSLGLEAHQLQLHFSSLVWALLLLPKSTKPQALIGAQMEVQLPQLSSKAPILCFIIKQFFEGLVFCFMNLSPGVSVLMSECILFRSKIFVIIVNVNNQHFKKGNKKNLHVVGLASSFP